MFISVAPYPQLQRLVDDTMLISEELKEALQSRQAVRDALLTDMAMDFPSNQWTWENAINTASVGYDLRHGGYTMFSLYKKGHTLELARAAFPKTMSLLEAVSGIEYACVSALSPHAHLALHAHSRRHYIFHLLLNNLIGGGCMMFCNGQPLQLAKAGDSALFDYSLPHESRSHAENIRFNLMVDFCPNRTQPS